MKPILRRPIRCVLLALLLGLANSCGDEPQRIEKSASPVSPHAASPHSASGATGSAPTTMPDATVRLAGRVKIAGSLAKAHSGAIFMIARNGGRTALVHRYEMSGPFWSAQGDERVLTFSLTDQDNMGGVGAPIGAKMELEARYDPDGYVDTRPGIEKKGVVKAFGSAAIGDTQISLELDPDAAPQAPPPATKPSGG
jgi:hypothetical protein